MATPLLLSVKEATVRYGETTVFEDLSFNIHKGKRIALVGRNGAGKSTLMNIITGVQEMEVGERWEDQGLTIGYLKQEFPFDPNETVFDFILKEIPPDDREIASYKVDIIAASFLLDTSAKMGRLSGGELRRTGLARILVEEPEILLLDEPTNHLDLEAIEWLENYLKGYNGTLMCISHDRTFLSNITDQVFWLDRGQIRVSPKGFKYFDEWSEELLEQERRELDNRKQMVALEMDWANRGVKARVKRNVRRLEQAHEIRDQYERDKSAYRQATKKIKVTAKKGVDDHAKVVAEFYNVHKSFGEGDQKKTILEKFSLLIKRGDRIGILGKNGSGKTTFLKLLIGEIEPDKGNVKRRKELEFSYFDQKRRTLNMNDTLQRVLCPEGGDYIDVMDKKRHVYGYLKDFMFDPKRVQDKVSTLSGGQKNRLMLAKILANPKSCLILDEPTNDLDMDTLDMLEEILSKYQGTLLVVSHDRDFLDQTVNKIIAFEGNGVIEQTVGGYSDYLEWKQKNQKPEKKKKSEDQAKKSTSVKNNEKKTSAPSSPKKMSYKDKYELEQLPQKIQTTEARLKELKAMLSDADFYQKDPDAFHEATKEFGETESKLERYENRWLELEDQKARIENS